LCKKKRGEIKKAALSPNQIIQLKTDKSNWKIVDWKIEFLGEGKDKHINFNSNSKTKPEQTVLE
jgi:hypothetical protein